MKLTKKIVYFVYKSIIKLFSISFAVLGGCYKSIKAAFAAINLHYYLFRSFVIVNLSGVLLASSSLWIIVPFILFFIAIELQKKPSETDSSDCSTAITSNSPLESFNVYIEENFIFFSNISINIFLIFSIIIFFFSYFNNKSIKKNIPLINLLNFFFNFFFNTFKNLVPNVRYERYFFILLTTFVFIVFENLGGFYFLELPFTSHAIITLFLSFILFFNYVITMLINFNESCYKKFVQKDINVIMSFFLFFIELISFLIRPFSLGIRLFANILSGHILVHIFFTAFIFAFKFMFWFSLLILIFCLFILVMEIFVAVVQAYIFFILNLIYLNETSKIHI